jgi:hypothetical protein
MPPNTPGNPNNFEAVLEYIEFVAPEGNMTGPYLPGAATKYRNPESYWNLKKVRAQAQKATAPYKIKHVKHMRKDYLNKYHLDPLSTTTSNLNGQQKAMFGILYAMAIIRGYTSAELDKSYARMRQQSEATLQPQLRTILSAGDSEQPNQFPLLTLMSFLAAPRGFRSEAISAYGQAVRMLEAIHTAFGRSGGLSATRLTHFPTYFGNPAALYTPTNLPFNPNGGIIPWGTIKAPPAQWTALEIVKAVYERIIANFLKKPVTIRYGGKVARVTNFAYVPSNKPPPVRIHLCPAFFRPRNAANPKDRKGRDSPAGTLIHEMSHTFAKTKDHGYSQTTAVNLATNNPAQALTNADNYQYFAEDAFWSDVGWSY